MSDEENQIACRVCGEASHKINELTLLQKHLVAYYKCPNCLFIQTESPHWLDEAYSSVITRSDIGLIQRNLDNVDTVKGIIQYFFDADGTFLDYAGGYGMFVRLMRDKGFNFYRQDSYCENLFAEHFDQQDAAVKKFDLITAFEVFEHFEKPNEELNKISALGDHLFFTTTLYPDNTNLFDPIWDYLAPETGQHIAFYHTKTLSYLANKHGYNYYTNGSTYHLFTRKKINNFIFRLLCSYRTRKLLLRLRSKRSSLLLTDYQKIKSK